MCTEDECRRRFRALEVQTAAIAADISWTKNIIRAMAVMIAATLGFDVSGAL